MVVYAVQLAEQLSVDIETIAREKIRLSRKRYKKGKRKAPPYKNQIRT